MMPAGVRRVRAFPSTDWRLVFASRPHGASGTRESTAELCAVYWYPVYAFLRKRGHSTDDAADLTQGFFAHILGNGLLARAQPEKGRLRSLLLASLTNFVTNERERTSARKRYSPDPPLSDAEARYVRERCSRACSIGFVPSSPMPAGAHCSISSSLI